MTPFEIGEAILDLALDALSVEPPARAYVRMGTEAPVDCAQIVVLVSRLTPSRRGLDRGDIRLCSSLNMLSVCVRVTRCHPAVSGKTVPSEADIEAASVVASQDGLDLYLGLDVPHVETIVGCAVQVGPEVNWRDPEGGYQTTEACLTVDFAPSSLGS